MISNGVQFIFSELGKHLKHNFHSELSTVSDVALITLSQIMADFYNLGATKVKRIR